MYKYGFFLWINALRSTWLMNLTNVFSIKWVIMQAHCLHSVLPPLPCSASLQTRPKGHPYELPRYKYDLSRKSFVIRCLYNFVWFYVFWLYDFICAFHIRLISMYQLQDIYNSSAVAEMGDRGHNRHRPKRGGAVPFSRSDGNPSNTMWPAPRSTSVPSGVFIHPAVWPQ